MEIEKGEEEEEKGEVVKNCLMVGKKGKRSME